MTARGKVTRNPTALVAGLAWRTWDARRGVPGPVHGPRRDKPGGGKEIPWPPGLDGHELADLIYVAGGELPPDGAPVVVCEGEKAADAAAETGVYAFGTVCGAASTPGPAVVAFLTRYSLTLSPDNDHGGRKHMERLAAALERTGLPALRWIDPPDDAPTGWDLADVDLDKRRSLIAGARKLGAFGMPAQPKPSAVREQPPLDEDQAVPARGRRRPTAKPEPIGGDGSEAWEAPTPLDIIDARPPFPTDALPDSVRAFVEAEAEAVQVPPDLPGMVCLAALATVCGGHALVQARPGWAEPVNLFATVVMDPGERKSAVFRDATAPVRAFEEAAIATAQPEIIRSRTAHEIADARLQRLKSDAAKAKTPDERYAAEADAQQAAEELAALRVVPEPRLFTTDVTAEKLASLLAEHDGQFAILSAEAGTFDRIAGLYSGGLPNLDVYLGGHAGDPIRIDRQGRPSEQVERPALTLGLTIQPSSLVSIRKNPALRGRGLLDRFLYSVPNGRIGSRAIDPEPVPLQTTLAYAATIEGVTRSLHALAEPIVLTLDPGAAARFRTFRTETEPRRGPAGDLAAISGWASKLDGAVARIAGLLHLAAHLEDGFGRPIDATTMEYAVAIGAYLIDHALVAFDAMGADEHRTGARGILAWIGRERRSTFRRREVQRGLHRQFARVADIEPALELLEEHGFIRPVGAPRRPGRPPVSYLVHPSALGDR